MRGQKASRQQRKTKTVSFRLVLVYKASLEVGRRMRIDGGVRDMLFKIAIDYGKEE